jgi:hypothetical protein
MLTLSKNLQSKMDMALLAKAMLAGEVTSFTDITGNKHDGKIGGIRAEGGKGLWLVKTIFGEYCVRAA